ncbi:MAG TPA: LysM domain-containing protein, partial [Aggregatilineales bacterium]|nr:LysM domain-containing protein [Aggregatilineales bacterium]
EVPDTSADTMDEAVVVSDDAEISAEERIATLSVAITPTLDPNLQYHIIQQGETLYDLVAIYNIDVKLLSEINPEIDFPQCDFGERFGGPTCAVFFAEGQQVRVPAPTPTPTIPPTASGSETPTPTATATINVPAAFAPPDGASFDSASIVTLRWTTTGTLGRDEVYAVHVTSLETETRFTGITCDQSFDLPPQWQPDSSGFTDFEWHITVNTVSPFGSLDDQFALRRAGYLLCEISYELPVEWDALLDVGIVSGILLADERYPTRPRYFSWQGTGN